MAVEITETLTGGASGHRARLLWGRASFPSHWYATIPAIVTCIGVVAGAGAMVPLFPTRPEYFADAKGLVVFAFGATAALALAGSQGQHTRAIPLALLLPMWFLLGQVPSNPWLAATRLATIATALIVYDAIRGAPREWRWLCRGAFDIVLVLLLVSALGEIHEWWRLSPRGVAPGGLIGNRNRLTHLLLLALPLLWHRAIECRGNLLALAHVVLIVYVTTVSRVRSAWLVGLLLISFLSCVALRAGKRGRRRWLGAILSGSMLAIFLPHSLSWKEQLPLSATAQRLLEYGRGSGKGRLMVAGTAETIIRSYPLTGVGFGQWPLAYLLHARDGDPGVQRGSPVPVNWQPTSDVLGIAAETGLPGLALFLSLLLVWGAGGASRWRSDSIRNAGRDDLSIARASTALTILLLGCFEPLLLTPFGAVWAAFVCASLPEPPNWTETIGTLESDTRLRRGAYSVGLVACAISCAFGLLTTGRRVRTWLSLPEVLTLDQLYVVTRRDPSFYEGRVLIARNLVRGADCASALQLLGEAEKLLPRAPYASSLARSCGVDIAPPNSTDAFSSSGRGSW